MKLFIKRCAETARLMVGIGNYTRYLQHMREHHPELMPMTEAEYVHQRMTSRYPGKGGQVKRCPC